MIVHDLRAHLIHQFIEALGSHTLEPGVRIPAGPDSVDDLAALPVLAHHLVHRIDIILAVTVNRDSNIAVLLGFHEARENSILMSPVPALGDSQIVRILPGQRLYDLPGGVLRTVIDKKDPALLRDQAFPCKLCDFIQEHRSRDRQYRFLVIAGNDDPQNRKLSLHVNYSPEAVK